MIFKGHNSETKKGEQSFVCGAHCLDLIYIFIKYHEDILTIVADGWTDRRTDGQHHAIIQPGFFSKWGYEKQSYLFSPSRAI